MNSAKAFCIGCLFSLLPFSHAADPTWEWVRIVGQANYDGVTGIAVDESNTVFFCGYTDGATIGGLSMTGRNFFWGRLNADGSIAAIRTAVALSGYPKVSLASGRDGSIVLNGNFNTTLGSPFLLSGDGGEHFVAKIASDLSLRWAKACATSDFQRSSPAAVNASGDIVVGAGIFSASLGGASLSSIGARDFLALHVTGAGALTWMKRGGGTDEDIGGPVCFENDGNVFVGGAVRSSVFAFGPKTVSTPGGSYFTGVLTKLGADGTALWIKPFGITLHSDVRSIKAFTNGDVVVGGILNSSIFPYEDPNNGLSSSLLLTRVRSDGSTDWSLSASGNSAIESIELDSTGNIYALGAFSGSISIGGKGVTSRGRQDLFAAKFTPTGSIIWIKPFGSAFWDHPGQIAVASNGAVYVCGRLQDSGFFDSTFAEAQGGYDGFIAKLSDPSAIKVPAITNQPMAAATYFGSSVSLSVGANSDVAVTYQWFKNGMAMAGKTSATLSFAAAGVGDDASYFVEVTNSYGTVRSDAVRLIVRGDLPVVVTTIAGSTNGTAGFVDATRLVDVRFGGPDGPAIQPDGVIVIPDARNNAIRLLEPSGTVGTLSGKGPTAPGVLNGPSSLALFNAPLGVAIGPGADIFVADAFNDVIRKISPFGARTVTTYAGTGVKGLKNGAAVDAQFRFPNDLVCDPAGNLFVIEFENHTVRKITADGVVSTYAGTGVAGYLDGAAATAQFDKPSGIARDAAGNIYVAEWNNHTIRKITPTGVVSTIAGKAGTPGFVDGPALTSARLNIPNGMAVDGNGNIFFTETGNASVRRIDPLGEVITLVGSAGPGNQDGGRADAKMKDPTGIAIYPDGSLIVTDEGNNNIRRVVWQTPSTTSDAVVLIDLHPSITIFGVAGKTYSIQMAESLLAPEWIVLGDVTLSSPVESWFDTQPVTRKQRYYRAVLKP